MYLYIYIYRGVQLKAEIQHTGIWLVTAWWPYCLCYCPAVFVCYLLLSTLSFLEGKIQHAFQNVILLFISYFYKVAKVWNCVTLNCVSQGMSVRLGGLKWPLNAVYYCKMVPALSIRLCTRTRHKSLWVILVLRGVERKLLRVVMSVN